INKDSARKIFTSLKNLLTRWENFDFISLKCYKYVNSQIGNDFCLISLDVVSLFTNIPIEMAVENCNISKDKFLIANIFFFYRYVDDIIMAILSSKEHDVLVRTDLIDKNNEKMTWFSLPYYIHRNMSTHSVIIDHRLHRNHKFNWYNVAILDSECKMQL
ncbi:hypothetical protein ALC56_06359, partial [Trachymyrmex septentrionalis]